MIRNLSGDILSDKNFLHDYPLCLEIKNKYLNKDTYIELKFYDENKIIEKQGTIDVLYKTRIYLMKYINY